jgi:uncharacterized protein YndB with AHSA1/START domain
MSPTTPVQARVTHRFSASAEWVFDAWLDPRTVGTWLFATPTGTMVRVEIDARVGGKFVITERREGEDVEHTGEYLEIERPRRLVFTVRVEKYARENNRVIVEITPLEQGCELTLTQEMAPDYAEYLERTKEGWTMVLADLERAVEAA